MEKESGCIVWFVNSFLRRIIGIRRCHEVTPTGAIRSFLPRLATILPEDLGIVVKAFSPSIHSGTTLFSFTDFPNLENPQLLTLNRDVSHPFHKSSLINSSTPII